MGHHIKAARRGTKANPIRLPNRAEQLKALARASQAQAKPPEPQEKPRDSWNEPRELQVAEHLKAAADQAKAGLQDLLRLALSRRPQPSEPAPPPRPPEPAAPAPPPPPHGAPVASVDLMGNNQSRTIEGPANVSLLGNNNRIVITGHCPELNLTGNNNEVIIKGTVGKIVATGNNNHVTWPASQDPKPEIINPGNGNLIEER